MKLKYKIGAEKKRNEAHYILKMIYIKLKTQTQSSKTETQKSLIVLTWDDWEKKSVNKFRPKDAPQASHSGEHNKENKY